MSIFPLTCSTGNSGLFRTEFLFKFPKLAYLRYRCIYILALYCNHYNISAGSVLLNIHSPGTAFGLSLLDCHLTNIFEPFLFKWSLPLLRCRSLILFELSIK